MSEVLLHHVECGPVLLLNTTAAPATVLTGLPGPDGDTHLCAQLATPVKHRLPATAEAADHPAAQFGRDAHGPFLWIYYVALHPRVPGTDLATPATNLPGPHMGEGGGKGKWGGGVAYLNGNLGYRNDA